MGSEDARAGRWHRETQQQRAWAAQTRRFTVFLSTESCSWNLRGGFSLRSEEPAAARGTVGSTASRPQHVARWQWLCPGSQHPLGREMEQRSRLLRGLHRPSPCVLCAAIMSHRLIDTAHVCAVP